MPKDVLGLGRHLVRELGLKDRGDTLGLWMAHHIAHLIKAAEKEKSPVKRKRAEKEATETILKIWEHRESLPSYAYPLARFDYVFSVLDRLLPGANPFRPSHTPETEIDRVAAVLFDNLSRFIICLLLMKPLSLFASDSINEAAIDALNEDEKHVWNTLLKWNEIFLSESDSERAQPSAARTTLTEIDLRKRALYLLKHIKSSIGEAEVELKKAPVEASDAGVTQKKRPTKKARKQSTARKQHRKI